jgi:hypothetical protein
MVQRREKEKDSRYIQEASAPAAVAVYQTCNIMYISNSKHLCMFLGYPTDGYERTAGGVLYLSCPHGMD